MKRLIYILFLFLSVDVFGQARNNNPSVFNIMDFGAKPDGKRITDGGINSTSHTFTSTAQANFSVLDVGKSIRVPGAGSSGHDLVTTISSFTNSTTVTLTAAAGTTVSADTCIYGTDNTKFIQAAIEADSAVNGIGTIFVPTGVFLVAGQLQTSWAGGNPNSQLVIPAAWENSPNSAFTFRSHYFFKGETAPNPLSLVFADSLINLTGSIIYSIIDGSGNLPSVFGMQGNSATIGYNITSFEDLTIMVPQNIGNGGPSMGGINLYWCMATIANRVLITVDGNIVRGISPTNVCAGIVTNKIGGEIETDLNNVYVSGMPYGIMVSDGANARNIFTMNCLNGLVLLKNEEEVYVTNLHPYWCVTDVLIPNVTIGGITAPSTPVHFKIENLSGEVYHSSGHWYDNTWVINDAGNWGVGDVYYDMVQSAGTWANQLFTMNGGQGITTHSIGFNASNWNYGIGETGGLQNAASGSLQIDNNFYLGNGGGAFYAKQTGNGQQLNFNGNQGYLRLWPWTVAGASPASQNFPLVWDSLGNVGLGGNASTFTGGPFTGSTINSLANGNTLIGTTKDSSAWLELGAATATNAQLYLKTSAGTNLTTAKDGHLWWNGSNLYFDSAGTNLDILHPSVVTGAPSLTATYIGYGSGGNLLTGTSDLFFSHANGQGGITENQNIGTKWIITNSNTGANGYAQLSVQGVSVGANFYAVNSGIATYGVQIPTSTGIYTNSATFGIGLDNGSAELDIGLGSSIPKIYYFNATNFNPAVTKTNDLGSSSLAWRDLYYSHTVSKTAMGASSSLGTNVTSMTTSGSDEDFQLTIVVAVGGASGTIGTLTFGRAWPAAPTCTVSPNDVNSIADLAGGGIALSKQTTTTTIVVGTILAGTTILNCHCGN